tara:strand:- start:5272 stop:5490 length:219 start_codon:yes stop_codon:yes gene_type:complete
MFDYKCHLCGNPEEWCRSKNLCSKCIEVKQIVAVYDIDSVLKTLKDVYVRDKSPIENRTKVVAKGLSPKLKE